MLPVFLTLVLVAPLQGPVPVDVDITLALDPETQVEFAISAPGASSGESRFYVADAWGGVSAGGQDLEPIAARGRGGRELEYELPDPFLWIVHHEPDEPLTIRYRIRANDNQEAPSLDDSRRPIVTDSLFHSHGHFALFFPEHLKGDEVRTVRFHWRGFEEAGWKVATAFGLPVNGELEARVSLWKAQGTIYLAGDLRIHPLDIAGSPVVIAMVGDRWRFRDEEFVSLAARIIEAERRFFDDLEQDFYLVSLIPNGPVVDPNTNRMGGTGLYRCFALSMSPNASLEGGAGLAVAKLIAHEHFHEWNGQVIGRVHPERLVYWFSEGFTMFYTRRLLTRAGILSFEEFADSLNDSLDVYRESPARNVTNQRVLQDMWNDPAVAAIPGYRGDLVAMHVDRAIREASGGERSLDDVMKELVAEGRAVGVQVDTDSLLERFAEAGAGDVLPMLRRVIVDGETAPIPGDLFAPCLVLAETDEPEYQLGFDLEASREGYIVRGVLPGSRAHAAGLRDGQPIRSWTLHGNRTDLPVELVVEVDGEPLEITYEPVGEEVALPRFSVVEGADCSGL